MNGEAAGNYVPERDMARANGAELLQGEDVSVLPRKASFVLHHGGAFKAPDFFEAEGLPPALERPADGWIVEVRRRLRMNVRQLANRLGITQQSASRLEANEKDDSITLKSLRRVADAMGCDLVYWLAPRDGVAAVLRKQAIKKAQESAPTEPGPEREQYIERKTDELLKNLTSRLWD